MMSHVILQTFLFQNCYDPSKGGGVGRKCFNRMIKSDGVRRENTEITEFPKEEESNMGQCKTR